MCVMNQQQALPLPNPNDWVTITGAAHFLGVHRRTIERMIERETLTGYRMWGAADEQVPQMIWKPELMQVKSARARVAAGGGK